MNRRAWSGLALGIIVYFMAPLSAVTNPDQAGGPWPALLSVEPTSVDPGFLALQHRANMSLERLVGSARASE